MIQGTMTIWKPSAMAAMETMKLKEASRLFVSRMGNGLKSHPARVRLVLAYSPVYTVYIAFVSVM